MWPENDNPFLFLQPLYIFRTVREVICANDFELCLLSYTFLVDYFQLTPALCHPSYVSPLSTIVQWFSECGTRTGSSDISWNVLKSQFLEPHSRPAETETLGVRCNTVLTFPLDDYDNMLKFENHCSNNTVGFQLKSKLLKISWQYLVLTLGELFGMLLLSLCCRALQSNFMQIVIFC